jgi:hypothetical protein
MKQELLVLAVFAVLSHSISLYGSQVRHYLYSISWQGGNRWSQLSTTRKKSGLLHKFFNHGIMDIHSCSSTNTKWSFIFKVELACIEVGTDRGEDNAKGIAETILKHLEKKIKKHHNNTKVERFLEVSLAQNILKVFTKEHTKCVRDSTFMMGGYIGSSYFKEWLVFVETF